MHVVSIDRRPQVANIVLVRWHAQLLLCDEHSHPLGQASPAIRPLRDQLDGMPSALSIGRHPHDLQAG
jgi:hypothetical protein